MDIAAFHTRIAASPNAPPPALAQRGSAQSIKGGLDGFLDLLLSSLTPESGTATKAPKTAGSAGDSPTDTLEGLLESLPENPSLDDLLDALRKAGVTDLAALGLTGTAQSATAKDQILSLLRKILGGATQDDLAALSAALNANDNTPTGAAQNLTASRKDILDRLDALISSGLTPAQMAELAEKLNALKAEKGGAMDAAFLASLLGQGGAAPGGQTEGESPAERQIRALLAQALTAPKRAQAGQVNAKTPGFDLLATLGEALEKKSLIGPAPAEGDGGDDLLLLTDGGVKKGKLSLFAGGPQTFTPHAQTRAPASPDAGLLTSAQTAESSPFLWNAAAESFEEWVERTTGTTLAAPHAAPGSAPVAAQTSASAAHAASQVAAVLYRAAQGPEARVVTLHLDPPELGRVAVRMEMDKNRTLRTVLTIEKPETHSLLQRDAHTLERALQNAGIDTAGGESLRFELAGENFDFGGNREDRHGGNESGQRADGTENALILETRMDWYVDPETGLQRYDILV